MRSKSYVLLRLSSDRHLVGLAMRICIEKGLHLKPQEVCIAKLKRLPVLTLQAVLQSNPLAAEIGCRVFWSIYTLDRLVSITLGRPMVGSYLCT